MLLNRTIVKRLRTELNSVLKESIRHESGFLDDQLKRC